MLRCILLICLAALGPIILKAQQTAKPDSLLNALGGVEFANQPTETLILQASYASGFRPLNDDNRLFLESINRLYGLDIKKFHYSIAVKLDGSAQVFDVPCCDEDFYHVLSAKANPGRIKVKCVVYRFYTIDGTTNFFYIDKATIKGI